jgi:hypothetical protein
MKKNIWLLAVVGAVLWGQAAWAQDVYVIVGGGVGTKISSVPYTIAAPGFYYLTKDLTYNGTTNAITVNADNVTVDLMGFTLANGGAPGGTIGIFMTGRANVEVRNGSVQGFYAGVWEQGSGNRHRAINIRATNNSYGILFNGNNHQIKNCNASNNTVTGFYLNAGIIADCVAGNNEFGILIYGPGNVLGNSACNNSLYNFNLGNGTADSIVVDRNSALGLGTNYYIAPATTGVVFGLNSGTP